MVKNHWFPTSFGCNLRPPRYTPWLRWTIWAHNWVWKQIWLHKQAHMWVWELIWAQIGVWEHIWVVIWVLEHIQALIHLLFFPGLLPQRIIQCGIKSSAQIAGEKIIPLQANLPMSLEFELSGYRCYYESVPCYLCLQCRCCYFNVTDMMLKSPFSKKVCQATHKHLEIAKRCRTTHWLSRCQVVSTKRLF